MLFSLHSHLGSKNSIEVDSGLRTLDAITKEKKDVLAHFGSYLVAVLDYLEHFDDEQLRMVLQRLFPNVFLNTCCALYAVHIGYDAFLLCCHVCIQLNMHVNGTCKKFQVQVVSFSLFLFLKKGCRVTQSVLEIKQSDSLKGSMPSLRFLKYFFH